MGLFQFLKNKLGKKPTLTEKIDKVGRYDLDGVSYEAETGVVIASDEQTTTILETKVQSKKGL